ncbi:MAG: efflux transporter outer membrane subunit [Rhodospirillales bacterium]|nr:efflux transporter outer membrane subunit [Rhodospirillales bacterium]
MPDFNTTAPPKLERRQFDGPPNRRPAGLTASVLSVALIFLSACETTKSEYAPPVQVPAQFSESGETALPDKWWVSLNDPVLNEMMEQALAGNLSIRSAWDRLMQAEAEAKKARADLLPTLDGDAGISGTRKKATATTGGRTITSTSDLSLGFSSSYEVDLWGSVRSSRDAEAYDLQASGEDLKTAAITLSSEVAATWYQLVEKYGQIDLLNDQADTNRRVLEVITLRFRRGQADAANVLQQRQLVESRRGDRIVAESQARVLEHKLSILMGHPPRGLEIPRINALAILPALPDTGVPADLVQRRPDIRKAYFNVMAADRRTAVAVADRFPKLTLTANVNTSGEYVRDLFSNWLGTLAGGLAAPLFDAGKRKAEVERTRAVTAEALHGYGQTVLDSLQEVEDALAQEMNQRRYIASLEQQIDLSEQALERLRDTYISGNGDYLSVLDALLTDQNLARTLLQAQRELIEFRVDLCKAIGGGWELPRPQSPAMATKRQNPPEEERAAGPNQGV